MGLYTICLCYSSQQHQINKTLRGETYFMQICLFCNKMIVLGKGNYRYR